MDGGGGGGGYSGGGGGYGYYQSTTGGGTNVGYAGGGGGSFLNTALLLTADNFSGVYNQGNGYVTLNGPAVTEVPEPGSLALLGAAGAGLLAVRRRKHRKI